MRKCGIRGLGSDVPQMPFLTKTRENHHPSTHSFSPVVKMWYGMVYDVVWYMECYLYGMEYCCYEMDDSSYSLTFRQEERNLPPQLERES